MPGLESGLRAATIAVVLFLLVSATAFFALGPGFSWFYIPPAPSPTPTPSPSVQPTPFEVPQASPETVAENASNATQANLTENLIVSPSPSPVQQIEIATSTATPLPPTQFGVPFSRSSFPISLRKHFPAALAARFADMDSDGNLDVLFFEGALGVTAYLSNGQRIWSWDNPAYETLAGAQAPGAAYDLDRNGRAEVAFVKAEEQKRFLVLADVSNGQEKARAQLPVANTTHIAIAVGDFSKSGWKGELAVLAANASVQKLVFYDSSLNKLSEFNSSKHLGFALAAFDVDGDGREEAIASGIAVELNGSVRWSQAGRYVNAQAQQITLADLQGDGSKEIVFSYGSDGLLVADRQGNEVWSTSISPAVSASSVKLDGGSALAALLQTASPLEQGMQVFSSGGGKLWGIDRQAVKSTSRPFECLFGAPSNLFYSGRFYDALQGNYSLEQFGRGIACADASGDGREELFSLREENAGAYLDVYSNPLGPPSPVAKKSSDLAYLLEKGTLPFTR